jgi:ketosteroid isomerase-like protein
MLCAAIVLATAAALPNPPSPAQPREVVKAFYEAANRGHIEEARDYYAPDAVKVIESTLGGSVTFQSFCDGETRKRTMTRLDVVSEEIDRGTAKVTVRLGFEGGGLAIATEYLENRSGRWRLAIEPSTPAP